MTLVKCPAPPKPSLTGWKANLSSLPFVINAQAMPIKLAPTITIGAGVSMMTGIKPRPALDRELIGIGIRQIPVWHAAAVNRAGDPTSDATQI